MFLPFADAYNIVVVHTQQAKSSALPCSKTIEVSICNEDNMFVYIDETGTDHRDALQKLDIVLEVNKPHP